MKQTILDIKETALLEISKCDNLNCLKQLKLKYLAKKSTFMSLFANIKDVENEEKATIGALLNNAKNAISEAINKQEIILHNEKRVHRLKEQRIDLTLPGTNELPGGKNPYYVVLDKIVNIFLSLGYEVAEGPEVELDKYNFELLNIPKGHSARDMQDTFYVDVNRLLRTHTSPVQARSMEKAQGHTIKMICPGKVYRRDDDDATHSHQFGQVEGLLIDKNINLGNLKATLQVFVDQMFKTKREIRFRSSYFPFTEPSVEVDVQCPKCNGKGCSLCKNAGWIEILGAGIVHPKVLKMSGYDPDIYSGFAFGIGIERVAILKYEIDDIRRFYQNDIRFIKQFIKE
jgi:phenylalanyl-tRNA synthetase alpha chain